jgi:hypothetical protein
MGDYAVSLPLPGPIWPLCPRIAAHKEAGWLKQFPAYLNRWDSQQARNEGVFAH